MNKDANLFRPEAIADRHTRSNGQASVNLPVHLGRWCLTLMACLAITGILLHRSNYAEKQRVPGQVDNASVWELMSPAAGRLTRVLTEENQHVKAGELIAVVERPATNPGLIEQLQSQIHYWQGQASRQRQLQVQHQEILERQSGKLKILLASKSRDLALQTAATHQALNDINTMEPLRDGGVLSRRDWQALQSTLVTHKQRLLRLQNDVTDVELRYAHHQGELQQQPIRNANRLAEINDKIVQLKQRIGRTRLERILEIRSPAAGTVTQLSIKAGDSIHNGHVLGRVAAQAGGLQVQLAVPSAGIAGITQGQSVPLLFDAYPPEQYGVFEGTVSHVSTNSVPAMELNPDWRQLGNVYLARVDIDDAVLESDIQPLPGMTLTAHLVLTEQPVLEWLLEPLLALRR